MIKEVLYTPIVVVHVICCTFLILVVLLQPGKSGGLGAFTGAAAQQVFGGRGAGNILTKISWTTATLFFLTSLGLAFLSSSADETLAARGEKLGKIDEAPVRGIATDPHAPAAPTPPPSAAPSAESEIMNSAPPVESAEKLMDLAPPAQSASAAPSAAVAPSAAPPSARGPVPTVPAAPAPVAVPKAPATRPAAPRPAQPASSSPY